MADVFGTDSRLGGIFKGTSFKMTIAGGGLSLQGSLVQSLNVQYQRQLSRIWELGSTDMYYVEGRAEGQASLQQIVGPKGLVSATLKNLADLSCATQKRAITLSAGASGESCNGGEFGETQLVLQGPVANGFTLGADAQQFVVNAGITVMFASMSL